MTNRSDYQRIYAMVDSIPKGRVATYGQVATEAGLPGHARQVGYALRNLPEGSGLPWHRVVNAKGEISPRPGPCFPSQRKLLRAEGVRFNRRGRIDLGRFGWEPDW
ncbi:MAG: MGMT family protein [Planctomycetota bacterium]